MINTSKNTRDIIIIAAIFILGGVIFFLAQQPSERKEQLTVERDLAPIELTQEEQQALKDEGIELLSGEEDAKAKGLQSVRSSDELDAIGADLNETDLGGLDAELEAIENDLLGL